MTSASAYLQQHGVSEALQAALASVIRARPSDPVAAIGQILLDAAKSNATPTSVDPRGLVDTTPGLAIDPATSALAIEMAKGNLSSTLTDLNLKKAGLKMLPPAIGNLKALTKLDISLSPLSELPAELGQLSKLRILFVLGAQFTSIPLVVGTLPSLYMLSFKSNQLSTIDARALAPTIEWLILTDNRLTALPATLPQGLRKVMLTNNRLASLPDSICGCRNLELIRLADNNLAALPDGFLALPKLAWLGLAGNPLVARHDPLPPPTWVPQEELTIGEQLGAGGGGFVHRAVWSRMPDEPVAIKIFRDAGSVTDGDPAHEIDLGSALSHPNVIRVYGATPAPKLGLVLELLDVQREWSELGRPPNFDTCARDTYPPSASFRADLVLAALRGVAGACAHLHGLGFTHGDLYAHNTLVSNQSGEAKVGDFGAAYNYEPLGPDAGRAIEAIEIRAFGCMAEELAERLEGANAQGETAGDASVEAVARLRPALDAIVRRCMIADVSARPTFEQVVAELDSASTSRHDIP